MKLVTLFLVISTAASAAHLLPEFSLEALREQHEKELREASKPVVETHIKRLGRLKAKLVKQDRLKEALAVEEEIASSKDRLTCADLFAALEGTWVFTTTGNKFHIDADGTFYGGEAGARVSIVDQKKRIVRVNAHLFTLSEDNLRLTGKGIEGGSKHSAKKRQ